MEVSFCGTKRESHHPCDPPEPCDPFEIIEGECPQPYLCLERLKNPMIGNTRCLPGAYINVKSCARPVEINHPCDPFPPCSTMKKKRPCHEPTLCYHRIKNPEFPRRPLSSNCDPTK
ncbi:unnamed protein product [Chrysodeixis includens]|uniref:Uncharacterized protein n=1 Tax=Chrysodeixis includens TaxID=689277 RepID=A0A9P0C012_CHRIL|nr:unnamed protein product [Chrysodeixis includens]